MLPLNTPRTLRDAKRGLPSLGDAIHMYSFIPKHRLNVKIAKRERET